MTTAPAPIRITVNGEPRELLAGVTVSGLLAQLGYTAGAVAVERNREVVPRRAHATTELLAGDEVEVVTFVGGG
jgi:sulfur carrier protein